MVKSVCVFCSSSNGVDHLYFESAGRLGEEVAAHHLELVYGGGATGLMGAVAGAAKSKGGRVVGVNLKKFARKETPFQPADVMIVAETLGERNRIMGEKADAFIALPGGYGTLEELSESLTQKQMGFHSKAVVILDINGYYRPLLEFLESGYTERFIKRKHRSLYVVKNSPREAVRYIMRKG